MMSPFFGLFLLIVHCYGEILTNPGQYGTFSCGLTEDCSILCDTTNACVGSTFYIYNNSIDIQCSASSSCREVTIISSNTTFISLTINSAGYAFRNGQYISDELDSEIVVTCLNAYSCLDASFYYNINQKATHFCVQSYSCWRSVLSVLGSLSLHCEQYSSTNYLYQCRELNMISMSNNINISAIGGKSITLEPIYIFITKSEHIPNLLCNGSNCKWNTIHYSYGIQFASDQACLASDNSCINNMISILDTSSSSTSQQLINNYPINLDFSYLTLTIDTLLILINPPRCIQLISPEMDNSVILSILCVGCHDMRFDLSNSANSIITSPGTSWKSAALSDSIIIGSTQSFKYNGYFNDAVYDEFDSFNTFYLNNTININLLHLGWNHDIYIGSAINVDITCDGEYQCNNLNIYSSIDQAANSVFTSGWNINCYCLTCFMDEPCNNFYIHFTEINEICNYTASKNDPPSSQCSTLMISTPSPPSILPSCPPITAYPTINPTTINPTIYPTSNPTMYPTDTPTAIPTIEPTTNVPTTNVPTTNVPTTITPTFDDGKPPQATNNIDTTIIDTNDDNGNNSNLMNNSSAIVDQLTYIIIGGAVFILILFIIIGYLIYRNHVISKLKSETNVSVVNNESLVNGEGNESPEIMHVTSPVSTTYNSDTIKKGEDNDDDEDLYQTCNTKGNDNNNINNDNDAEDLYNGGQTEDGNTPGYVTSGAQHGIKCNECLQTKSQIDGKKDDDGRWYCNECWSKY